VIVGFELRTSPSIGMPLPPFSFSYFSDRPQTFCLASKHNPPISTSQAAGITGTSHCTCNGREGGREGGRKEGRKEGSKQASKQVLTRQRYLMSLCCCLANETVCLTQPLSAFFPLAAFAPGAASPGRFLLSRGLSLDPLRCPPLGYLLPSLQTAL
jgi:hypothetical protein